MMAKKQRRRERSAGGTNPSYSQNDVRKDPLDLRDYMYQGSLLELPVAIDNREHVPELLNQQTEGACTGFALAAVINYLLQNHSQRGPLDESVSPRMLYEMAKRYDEWAGAEYEGSSIRGAMKGWNRHGVCKASLWRYRPDSPGRFSRDAQEDAATRPIGNYFRVRHLHLNHMHAAIREVGILLASAQVHQGWQRVSKSTGRIRFDKNRIGAHAFAIVGYDEDGFWIQNSWGSDWGRSGFAHLSYEDWLENSWDCWVARLGVPVNVIAEGQAGVRGRASSFDFITDEPVTLNAIRGHYVNLGNDGKLSQRGRYSTKPGEIETLFRDDLKSQFERWGGRKRLLLYGHGGLNDEEASAQRIASLLPYFMANRIYPLHFMWETGQWETLSNIVEDAFRRPRMTGWTDDLKERFSDLLDEAIELGSRPVGRPLWSEMKENARLASGRDGGALKVVQELARFQDRHGPLELHLVGHSAGSIFHAYLIPELFKKGIKVKTLTLFAPACRTELFTENVLDEAIGAIAIFNLSDQSERDDKVGPYSKSLLYLVSEAFEDKKPEKILGMEKYLEQDSAIIDAFARRRQRDLTVVYTMGISDTIARSLRTKSTTHGGFDNDGATLNSMLRVIMGRGIEKEFPANI